MPPTRQTRSGSKEKKDGPKTAGGAAVAADEPQQDTALSTYTKTLFPIVGVGASAGGIEPFNELLRHLPELPGVALIYVLHQEPRHVSALAEVLARATPLPVETVIDGTTIEVDHVYVAPPDADVHVRDGVLRLQPRRDGMPSRPVDTMLRTLAEDQGSRSIAVILSGTASDGSAGAKAIKAEGGITFAQDETARFDGMPRSAASSGSIDFILPPRAIARELVRIARHPYVSGSPGEGHIPEKEMARIFTILQAAHDVDFTHYKPSTVERRIRRRMALHRLDTLTDYLAFIREHPEEVERLYSDILIRVTAFFRDPEVYDALTREVLPALSADREHDQPIRVWVPGCATGEEAYSLAIVILEHAAASGWTCPVQIFATDVSEEAVDVARAGIYPDSIAGDVSPERLRRFFSKEDNGYRVNKAVRDCCVFARQNLTKDPPFSRLDLVSCRNVMIYLGAVLQRKVMAIFHYALRHDGYLLLGSSETIGNYGDLFRVIDRKHKVYQKKAMANRMPMDFAATAPYTAPAAATRAEEELALSNVFREADRVLLARFAPAGVLVNEEMEIVQFRGKTSAFLEPAPGAASFNLFKMAREGLLAELRTAIHSARKRDTPVRREGARVKHAGGFTVVTVEVVPLLTAMRERFFLVLLEEALPPPEPQRAKRGGRTAKMTEADAQQVARLKRELEASREYLQSIIEEQEAMNEELRSANEEIQSSNEELQSTNEELETAKEELQSSNEELTTLNEELETRNHELAEVNNDLVNLLTSVDIPIVMLDGGLRIRRFNPGAQRVLNIIPSDLGRPISDLHMPFELADLDRLIHEVIDTLTVREVEVKDRAGRSYSLRIRPYKTVDNKIDGAVLVLVDISALRKE